MTWEANRDRLNKLVMDRFGRSALTINGQPYSVVDVKENIPTEAGYFTQLVMFLDSAHKDAISNNDQAVFDNTNYIVRDPRIENGLLMLELKRA